MAFAAGVQLLPTKHAESAIFLWLILLFLAVLSHEVGHAIVAKRLKATLIVFSVCGFGFNFITKRFGMQGQNKGDEIAGFVAYRSAPDRKLTLADHAKIAVGGPAANIVLALLAIALDHIRIMPVLHGSVVLFAILSFGMALTNLVPFPGSDGLMICKYVQSRNAPERR
jgi:membrane-associated protease RseP (regulator of RpoE activity)